ncbi:MAG: hypothetical protein WB778_00390 [Thermoplasmata archaeon]
MTDPPKSRASDVALFKQSLDMKMVEGLILTVFQAMFRDGVRIPLKMNGMVDLDLTVKDNNVRVNMNQFRSTMPELTIWRIIFAYRGKPVVEYGRGIKNDMKIHFPQLFFLMIAIWRERRKNNRARARGEVAREREMVTMSVTDPKPGRIEGSSV